MPHISFARATHHKGFAWRLRDRKERNGTYLSTMPVKRAARLVLSAKWSNVSTFKMKVVLTREDTITLTRGKKVRSDLMNEKCDIYCLHHKYLQA